VTAFAATVQDGEHQGPAAAASARVPTWLPPIDSYRGEPTAALPSSPLGFATRGAAAMWDRGEHDLDGQAVSAPGARRPVIAQDLLSPLAGDVQEVTSCGRTHKD
jgi:hypothetical protein